MICPHDHHECDNRGCRYGGCQGRRSERRDSHGTCSLTPMGSDARYEDYPNVLAQPICPDSPTLKG